MAIENMARKIKELRQAKGLTLEQVANVVGVGKSTVRKWETGMIANMKRDKIADLAKALGTTPAYLMGWSENVNKEEKNPPEQQKLSEGEKMWLELYHRVSGETREVLITMMDSFDKIPTDKQQFVLEMIRVALGNQK